MFVRTKSGRDKFIWTRHLSSALCLHGWRTFEVQKSNIYSQSPLQSLLNRKRNILENLWLYSKYSESKIHSKDTCETRSVGDVLSARALKFIQIFDDSNRSWKLCLSNFVVQLISRLRFGTRNNAARWVSSFGRSVISVLCVNVYVSDSLSATRQADFNFMCKFDNSLINIFINIWVQFMIDQIIFPTFIQPIDIWIDFVCEREIAVASSIRSNNFNNLDRVCLSLEVIPTDFRRLSAEKKTSKHQYFNTIWLKAGMAVRLLQPR